MQRVVRELQATFGVDNMSGTNTKQRTERIQSLARQIVRESNPNLNEIVHILPLAKKLMDVESCGIDAAKRHIAKAIRNLRYHWLVETGQITKSEPEPEAQRGGLRSNPGGRPRKA